MYQTRYAIVYQNEDGSFSTGKYLHRHQWCAVDNIPLEEVRPIVCIAQVQVFDVKHNDPVITPAELREMWAGEIAEEKVKWQAKNAE